jgi:hypothetical protein
MQTRYSPVVVLALALALTSALPAQAAPRSLNPAEPQRLLSRLVTFLGIMPGRLVAFWEKEGAGVDPFGGPRSTTPPQDPDSADATSSPEPFVEDLNR